ncbi:MAG: DUF1778 domain-containing protein [Methyloprofundus sp.]|nr:DUF1778 domain-containing protein [Methyloprofundus sp.]
MSATQISAYISDETKSLVEAYSKKSGVKKGFLIEEALLHHLQALKEFPLDIIIPAKITLTDNSMKQLVDIINNPPSPTENLKQLMHNA